MSELEEMSRAEKLDAFVTALVNEAFELRGSERDDKNARRMCGRMLAEMFAKHVLSSAGFAKG